LSTAAYLAAVRFPQSVQSFIERVADRPWAALIELLLISSVVFTILRFLHGTRGARLVRAVVIILAVSFAVVWLVAEQWELDRINVLYPYFMLGVFLVSLVAFQTELRRMLLRLGEGSLFQRWMKESVAAIGPIVTAVERLSARKIGALIAIQRGTELGALLETGVRLDARISAELLETVFWPGTALHDMGMIVHQDRVLAAGCQFPLAESGDIDRALGSRHRAALGMSQEVDAVVVIVSEETGTISVAMRGRMQRALTPEALRSLLARELSPRRTRAEDPVAGRESTAGGGFVDAPHVESEPTSTVSGP
jgi:diadenylate cyclase